MGYEFKRGMKKGYYTKMAEKETIAEVSKLPFADYPERGIRKETYEKFGVRMALSTTDRSVEAIYFPYYNQDGKLTGYKKRDLTLDKYDAGHFTVVGKVGVQNKLFGQHVAETIKRAKKKLFIVEGEYDCLSSYQACVDTLAGTKYEGLEPFVVGLSCGTGNAKAAVSVNLDHVESYETVVLGFDADEATPEEAAKKIKKGKEATEDVGLLITKSQVMVAEYKDFHDPNDYVKAGKFKELANALSFATKKFTADKVVTAESISFEELVKPRTPGVNIPQFPKLMEMTGGCRKRELWVACGPSGVGKSFVCSTIAAELRLAGHRVGMIFLEEELKETILRMVAHKCKVNYNKMKFDPTKYASTDELQEAFKWVKEDDGFVFLDHFGSMMLEHLMNKIKYLMSVFDVDFIILDHLSMLVSGIATTDERKMLDMVMTELAAFVASHDIGIIAVSHLNRGVAEEFKAPKGKEDEPFFINVKKESLRGSSSLEQLSWVILGLEPEIMPDRSRGCLRLTVLKNRPWGQIGHADVVKLNEETGQLEPAEQDYF